jgi:Fe-S oxidoreductase
MSMADPRAALGDDRLHGILDLCLECKACKSECPLGVDMAALKTEALAAYHEQHGVPVRSRLFGSIRTLNRLGSAVHPVSNMVAGWRPALARGQRRPAVAQVRANEPGQLVQAAAGPGCGRTARRADISC